jgi:hypothetical protein
VQGEKIVVAAVEKSAAAEKIVEPPLAAPPTNPLAVKPATQRSVKPQRIVFVLLADGDMLYQFSALRRELTAAIQELNPGDSFDIFVGEGSDLIWLSPTLLRADAATKLKAAEFLEDKIVPRGEYSLSRPLAAALYMNPDVIWIASNGNASWEEVKAAKAVLNAASRWNGTINTVVFPGGSFGDADVDVGFLWDVAKAHRGICIDRNGRPLAARPKRPLSQRDYDDNGSEVGNIFK